MEAKRTIRNQKRYRRKKAIIRWSIWAFIFLAIGIMIGRIGRNNGTENHSQESQENGINGQEVAEELERQVSSEPNPALDDWKIRLANKDNILPSDFTVELAKIDKIRKFDKRAIEDLQKMMNDLKKAGYTNIWVQSSYRSIQEQEKLYQGRVKEYMNKGKTQEEAERLTQETINKPGASDHNLGLAVDFNEVTSSFERLKGYQWLEDNAQDYGFILRYPKDKVEITGVTYEPWHWRYVGQEHATIIKEHHFCLEEYHSFLKNEKKQV